jgi:hypothetical protein
MLLRLLVPLDNYVQHTIFASRTRSLKEKKYSCIAQINLAAGITFQRHAAIFK